MTEHIAVIHKDKDSEHGASFPDLPGVITAAEKLEDCAAWQKKRSPFTSRAWRKMASPCLLQVRSKPLLLASIIRMPLHAPDTDRPNVRVNITLVDTMLDRIDRRAAELGMTYSGFLLQAIKHEMERKVG